MASTRGVGVWTASGLFMLCMKARALSRKSATCVHASDAMRSCRVMDRYQFDPIHFEVFMTSTRHATLVRGLRRFIVCLRGVEKCVMSV